jgi:nucleoside-diphosphate-sugar epimerase
VVEEKNLLISGGTGYLGSHFLNSLKEANVFIIDRNIKKIRLKQEANLYIEKNIEQINLDDIPTNIDKFIHTSYCKNLESEKKLFELVLQKNPSVEIIFFSSSAVYGDLYLKGKENFKTQDPAKPVNDYGRYKLELENFIKETFENYKLLRISNPYGKEYEVKGVYQLFKKRISKSLETNHQASFIINYPQAMTMSRDMVFIEDAIKQILLIYNLEKTGIFNISSGEGRFLEDLAYLALKDYCLENNLETSKFRLNFTYRKQPEGEIIQSILEPYTL